MATKRLERLGSGQPGPQPAAAPSLTPSAPGPLTQQVGSGAPVWQPLTNEQILMLPNIHLLLYGDSGSGKSTFAATFVARVVATGKPMLILAFDPWDKMTPYQNLGKAVPVQDEIFADYYKQIGIAAEDVIDDQGNLLARIEYYADPDPKAPVAMDALETRINGFEHQAPEWSTIIIDSMTFMQYASLNRAKFKKPMELFGQGTDMRQWYAIMKIDIEQLVKSRAVWWRTNVVVIFHTSEDKDEFADQLLRGILTVGKLQKELPPGFGEMYRVKLVPDPAKKGEHMRLLQTRHDGIWAATSIVAGAPNPSAPYYDALWGPYLERKK